MQGRGRGGLHRATGKKQVEADEPPPMERPQMKEKSSFFGNLMKSSTKFKDNPKKSKKLSKKAQQQQLQQQQQAEPQLRQAPPSTLSRPSHPSVLSSYTLEELKLFCTQSNIDYQIYDGHPDEKKQIVLALTATYPPDPVRHHYNRVLELEAYSNEFKERVAEYKKAKDLAKQDNISFPDKAPKHSDEMTAEVNQTFELLLSKFEVSDSIKRKLMKSFTTIEKIQHLRNAVCVLDNDQNFMQEDEDMITIMDSDRFIDSIRLLTCKYRIMNSTPEWLSNFCTSGGISVLVENMDNRLDKDPMEITDAAALLQLIYCLKHIMQTDGLNVAIATRGAIDAFCMSLRFEYQTLALEVLEILAVVCTFGGKEGVIQTVMGFHHLARVRGERPFAVLVDALQVQNPQIQAAVLALVNAMMTVNIELTERISYRNDLRAVAFNERVQAVSLALNGSKEGRGQELLRMESIARLENRGQSIKFQPGMSISHGDVERSLAEDGRTVIHPEQGMMAGICWEAKKSKSGVKKRWYEVKNGVFSWYHLEERQKDINCEANGSQEMASVVEIMGYSTSPDLQRMFKYCFVFQCSDGQRYQFGVQDQITKQRWIVALQTSMSRASQERTAYTIENTSLPKDLAYKAKLEFNKQLEIYHGIETADRELFISACKDGTIMKTQEISGYLQQDFLSRGPEEGKLIEAEYLKLLAELLVASNDPSRNIRDVLCELITTIHTPNMSNPKTELILKKNESTRLGVDHDLDALLVENEALRAKLTAGTQEKKTKSKWKEMLGLAKAQHSRPSFLWGKSSSKVEENEETKSGSLKPASLDQILEVSTSSRSLDHSSSSQSLIAPATPVPSTPVPSTPVPLTPVKTYTPATPESSHSVQFNSPQAVPESPSVGMTSPQPVSETEDTKPNDKLTPGNPLASLFAGRAQPPLESAKSGRIGGPGRGDALAGLFAGRGLEAVGKSNPDDTQSPTPPVPVKGGGLAGRGGGLAGLFAGRGAGPVPFPAPDSTKSGGAMKMAVISSRPIPIPPYLPGQTPQSLSGAPLLPGQQQVESVLPSKPKIVPNVKMRQLQWLPLKPKEALNTLWTEIVEPTIDDFVAELETGYGIMKIEDNVVSSLSEKKSKPKKESLFDGRRTQNIAITVGKLKMSPDEITTLITELDPNVLTAEMALTLLPLCPTPDDIKLIRGYEGKDEDLDIPGRVMSRLVDIPRLEQRLKTHITSLTWEETSFKLESKLDTLGDAVAELRDDSCMPSLKEVLSLVLAIGNYMNGGTNKGQAHGIRLNGLLKLVECRKNGSKTETLLHQVIKLYRLKHTDDELFYNQWINVWSAKNLSLKQLEIELKELEVALQDVQKELNESDKIVEDALRTPLKRNLSAFLAFGLEKQQKNVETMSEVKKFVMEIRQYFGDTTPDKEEDAAQVFFKTISEFAVQYIKGLKEIDEWADQERRAKEALEKAEIDKQRRASLPPALNLGLFKINHRPGAPHPSLTSSSSINAFKLYHEEQALSSEDRISFFKKQMMDRRGAITQTATTVNTTKGMELLEETESENEDSEEEWDT